MQKYRADQSETQPDGAIVWSANWMGGPSLARINNCRLANLEGDMRRTVYITGEADTYFSTPAVCLLAGKRVRGYVTTETTVRYVVDKGDTDTHNLVFRHCYY